MVASAKELEAGVAAAKSFIEMFAMAQKAAGAIKYLDQVPAEVKRLQAEIQGLQGQVATLTDKRAQLQAELADTEVETKRAIATLKADVERETKATEEQVAKIRANATEARKAIKAEMADEQKAHQNKLAGLKDQIKGLKKSARAV